MIKKLYLTLLFVFCLWASPNKVFASDLNFSLSNLCEYVGKIQTNGSGQTNFCSFLPSFASSYESSVYQDIFLAPQIGFTLPQSGRDENIKRMTFFLLLNSKYKTSYVNFVLGAGLYFTRISGPGGDSVLNNGSSSDSFPLPSDAVYSRNLILNLGLDYDINKDWSVNLYSYVFNVTSSDNRSLSLGIGVTYHYGEVL